MKKWLPILLTGVLAAWFLGTLQAPKQKTFDFTAFGRLPVVFNGRFQPLDSVARNALLQLREKQTANLEPWKSWYEKPKIISAIEWFANVTMNPAVADAWPIFRVDNPELIALLKLPSKDLPLKHDGKHYSWSEIAPSLDVMQEQTARIGEREQKKESDAGNRTAFERAVMKMHERLVLYMRLKNTLQPQDTRDWSRELVEYERLIVPGVAAARAQQRGEKHDEAILNQFLGFVQRFDVMSRMEPPLIVPPHEVDAANNQWMRAGEALMEAARGGTMPPALGFYAAAASDFKQDKVDGFNKQIAAYHAFLAADFGPQLTKVRWETLFNRMQPFYDAMVIYVLAGLLAGISWFNASNTLRRCAVWLIGLAFIIHTTGLIFRMTLEGRPPVTNLYSSAIFIGWGAVVLGLVLERFYKDGIGSVVASSMAFLTLIIAHHLSLAGDTMEMMRAVLDTNFWLATHVVVVTLGYASTFVAGFLALIYIVRGMFTTSLSAATAKGLTRMIYGIVCFATLFSFVGTVLGGIWADQSWGRFWGWDPKENGALIIVLWNALILHLRWGGMIRERGLAVCAIGGNIVTSWSWFGVNMLGIGLHSYGFMDAAFKWLMFFVATQLILILLGALPLRYWASFRGAKVNSQKPAPKPDSRVKPRPAGADI